MVATTAVGSPPRGSLTKLPRPRRPPQTVPARRQVVEVPRGAVWVAGFVCPCRGARSDHLPRRKIPRKSSRESTTRRFCYSYVVTEIWWLAPNAENRRGGLWAAPLRLKMRPRSVRDRSLGIWRECRIHLRPTQEIECHIERFVVFGVWRNVRLRAGLLLALIAFQMASQ